MGTDETRASRANNPEGFPAVKAASFIFLGFGSVRIDVETLLQMAKGDRIDTLRALGTLLARFSPEAADHLESYDGAIHSTEPIPLPMARSIAATRDEGAVDLPRRARQQVEDALAEFAAEPMDDDDLEDGEDDDPSWLAKVPR